MVKAGQIQRSASGARMQAKAQLLLARGTDLACDRLAATALGALAGKGGVAPGLVGARKHGADILVLRSDQGFIGLSHQRTPLGAARFHGAIAPFSRASERGELMRLIEHHEAHITLKLTLTPPASMPVARLLRHAVAAIAAECGAIGLLWQPTGRLHGQGALASLLSGAEAGQLLVAPRPASIGPRRLPALRFVGARALLGYRVALHLLDISHDAASAAGFAFVEAALADPSLRARQSFAHGGHSFRIAHDGASRDITLLPVARPHTLARAA